MTPDGGETEQERQNRRLDQLLQETRVVMPGVQVLFAFLLAVVFQTRFDETTPFQRHVWLATILCVAASTACFIAPAAWHRILFMEGEKDHLITVSNRFVIAGVAFLAFGMALALLLVCDFVFGDATAAVVTSVALAVFAWLWFGAPLRRRARGS